MAGLSSAVTQQKVKRSLDKDDKSSNWTGIPDTFVRANVCTNAIQMVSTLRNVISVQFNDIRHCYYYYRFLVKLLIYVMYTQVVVNHSRWTPSLYMVYSQPFDPKHSTCVLGIGYFNYSSTQYWSSGGQHMNIFARPVAEAAWQPRRVVKTLPRFPVETSQLQVINTYGKPIISSPSVSNANESCPNNYCRTESDRSAR